MKTWERWEYLRRGPQIAWAAMVHGEYRFDYDLMPIVVRGMGLSQRVNLLKSGLNLAYRRTKPWAWPLHMQVELTSFCELECPVCPTGTGELERSAKSIDVELVEQLFSEVGRYLLTVSLWGWGEPLLHKKLGEILAIVERYPVATLLSTNGQSLTTPRVQEALRSHPPTYLIVALDGLTDETNSVYRRGAKLQPALEGVKELAEWKRMTGSRLPVLHCRFMAMSQNEHELTRLEEFSREAGFDMASVRSLSIVDTLRDRHRDMVPVSDLLRAYSYQGASRVTRDDFICQHAFTFPTLMADGSLVACEQDYNCGQAYGKLSPQISFAELWNSRTASAVRRVIRDTPSDYSFCRNCPYADRPISSCSIQSYPLRPFTV
jgi:radical SAM protein with 4Fe4S-binding SPASM domain